MARRAIPTQQQLRNLEYRAGRGDAAAEAELRSLARSMAKRANQRMVELEKAGYETAALNRAQYWLNEIRGRNRYRENVKTLDMDILMDELEKSTQFLRWQTSTVAGENRRRKKILAALEDKGIEIKNEKIFLEFLDSDMWNEFKKYIGTDLQRIAGEVLETQEDLDNLKQMFKRYQEGRIGAVEFIRQMEGIQRMRKEDGNET